MGLTLHLFLAIALGFGAYIAYNTYVAPPVEVEVEENGWFGAGPPRSDDLTVHPFKVEVPDDVLEDLKHRLVNSRVSHSYLEDSDNFWYGFNSRELEVFRKYWLYNYNWKKQEAIINQFKQFKTEIEGLKVHFIHEPAAKGYKKVLPLLIVHGWPGNVYEFYKMIPMLTDPKKHGIKSDVAFEVIAPSIPGYGWSEQPKKTGFSQVACARVFRKLMERLGFKRFYLQGGDWGSLVTSNLAKLYPDQVFGIHLNMMAALLGASMKALVLDVLGTLFPKFIFSSSSHHDHNMLNKMWGMIVESGYMHLQATKPDTVGTALNDSPLGLAAYILEKFSTWTNLKYRELPDGGLTKKFSRDELLTIVMIYWVNGNIVSSQRFYREYFLDSRNTALQKQYLRVPTAHASGMNEVFDKTPPEISSALCNLTHYTAIEDMGHFAAFEMPQPLAADIFDFVNSLEQHSSGQTKH
ncbi:hydrolase, alpha/beta domain protein [Necator americanus]|uniref:Epoxide hydrolase n=1 Tax=Necator americanus TaxID=51031 RepID=W2TBM8_NECAM|nr:hydrolase, alpha/beta domain protein [Necator americanus]ETN78999.1 hydrolase, alpha/beta domain protein [Necator americanus]